MSCNLIIKLQSSCVIMAIACNLVYGGIRKGYESVSIEEPYVPVYTVLVNTIRVLLYPMVWLGEVQKQHGGKSIRVFGGIRRARMYVLLSAEYYRIIWILLEMLAFYNQSPICGVFYGYVYSCLCAVLVGVFPKMRNAPVFSLVSNGIKVCFF